MHDVVAGNPQTLTDAGEGDALLAEAAALRALPAFAQAIREYSVGLAKFREDSRLINKMVSYDSRHRVVGYLFYLHADRERYGPAGGATYGRLHDLCTRRNEVSPRTLKTTLALLRLTGFVSTVRGETDRRQKFYRPMPRMLAFVEGWLGYATAALDTLQPRMRRGEMLRDDPTFIERFLVAGGRDHADNEPPADRMPEFIGFFGAREGANAVILAVILAGTDGTPVPSRARIAKRYGLSKTQITHVIGEGERIGYFAVDAAGIAAATQKLRDDFSRWISIELAFYARHMRRG
jgi:hypothetical protein